MRYLVFLLFSSVLLFANKSYMATIQPVQTYTLFAQASGVITKLDNRVEHTVYKGELLTIDDSLEHIQLEAFKSQLDIYTTQLDIRNSLYEKAKTITGKSQTQIDELHLSALDMRYKTNDLKRQIKELQRTIDNKHIKVDNLYIKTLHVNKLDFVNAGTQLATLEDTSKAKLIVYVHKDEIKDLKNKTIYIDGNKSKTAKLIKLDSTTDTVYVSSHKAEIHLNSTEFGRVVKVEFR